MTANIPALIYLGAALHSVMWLVRVWLAIRFRRSVMRGMDSIARSNGRRL